MAREGWGYTLGERQRWGGRAPSGQVSRRADTSGADLRVFEASGYTTSGTVVVSYRRATRVTVVSVVFSSSWSFRRGVATFGRSRMHLYPAARPLPSLSPSAREEGRDRSQGLIARRRAEKSASSFPRVFQSIVKLATFARVVVATAANVPRCWWRSNVGTLPSDLTYRPRCRRTNALVAIVRSRSLHYRGGIDAEWTRNFARSDSLEYARLCLATCSCHWRGSLG